jgi:hypothetical protein
MQKSHHDYHSFGNFCTPFQITLYHYAIPPWQILVTPHLYIYPWESEKRGSTNETIHFLLQERPTIYADFATPSMLRTQEGMATWK